MAHSFSGTLKVECSTSHVSDAFVERLFTFYEKQEPHDVHLSPIWHGMYADNFKELCGLLNTRNTDGLKVFLDNLYSGSKVAGLDIAMSDWTEKQIDWFALEWDAQCLTTAAAIGVIHAFCPTQNNSQVFSREQVVIGLEEVLGLRLAHTGGARMPGAVVGERFIPLKMVECAITVGIVDRLLPAHHVAVEIGAGTGFTAHMLAASGKTCHTVDLPAVSVMQAFVLSLAFGENGVWLEGEIYRFNAHVYIHGLALPNLVTPLVINQNSMPEMPEAEVVRYLKWIEAALSPTGVFLSINHESSRGGQNCVHELVEDHSGLRLQYRAPHFGREGYMQEIFVKP